MTAMSWTLFLYVAASLLLPLKMPWPWKLPCAAVLLAVAHKNQLFQRLGGGMFFAPELPRPLILLFAWLYSALVIMLFMLILKDAAWVLWKIFAKGRAFPVNGIALAIVLSSALLSLYGTWAAFRVPEVNIQEVRLKRLPKEFDGLKIALLADLHASAANQAPLLQAIVDRTNALNPDVILLNGDMVDGTVARREKDVAPLARLKARIGVWGSSGNHEYYSGYQAWLRKFKELGITMLENSHAVLEAGGKELVIAGTPDHQGARSGFEGPDLPKALKGAPRDAPVILMAHRPESARENADLGVDLQLSGHTHGGMMPGLDLFIARFNGGFVKGWYGLGSMKLYVSPGTLLWNGFPLRIMDPSEITLFVLRSEEA